jgi:hypothetical protein
MSIKKLKELRENIDNVLHYYEIFLEDGSCAAQKTRKLLKESEALIHSIEEDIWDRLIELEFYEEARVLRPRRELDFSTRAFDLTTDHTKGIKKTSKGEIKLDDDNSIYRS